MSIDTSKAGNVSSNEAFDQIINLISEIVVIKARIQQLMDTLLSQVRENRDINIELNSANLVLDACEKQLESIRTDLDASKKKELTKKMGGLRLSFDKVSKKIAAKNVNAIVTNLDEAIGGFGKALGELQNVLMNMRDRSLSIAIIQVLLVTVDENVFAFPLDAVLEIVNVKREDIYSVDGNETIKLREHVLGLIKLEETIGVKRTKQTNRDTFKIIIVTNGSEQLGVAVDSLLGEGDIVIKKLSDHFSQVKGVRGASLLGNGDIALILDPAGIIEMANQR